MVDRQVYALWNVLQKRSSVIARSPIRAFPAMWSFHSRVRTFDDALESRKSTVWMEVCFLLLCSVPST